MSKLKKPSLMAPTPDVFVRSALGRLGIESRTTGYWSHTVMEQALNALPLPFAQKFLFSQLGAIRKKALKRKEKEQKKDE